MAGENWQCVVLGSGDARLEESFRDLALRHPDRVAVRIGFDSGLAHRIEAGSDIFLMPSRFEPCGLNQLYSLKYGTIPVVHATGGLADTVIDVNEAALAAGMSWASGFRLYLAVLEDAYKRIRHIESGLDLDGVEPLEALKRLVAFTFDYHVAHPDFVRLVMNENIHNGAFLAKSESIQQVNRSAIDSLGRLYRRGCKAGVFRTGLDAVDLHMSISALCFFTVANRHTFSLGFQRDLSSSKALAARRRSIVDMVVRHMAKAPH